MPLRSTYIIAEAGVNHNGEMKIARELIRVAKRAGADAVKFQIFQADALASRHAAKANYQLANHPESGQTQLEMLRALELTFENFRELKKICDEERIDFMATPFDEQCAHVLLPLVSSFKIASGDITTIPLLRTIGGFKKPVFLSTGMSTLAEVETGLTALRFEGDVPVTLLHCTSNYPCPIEDVNLRAMVTMGQAFQVPVGYSDHTLGFEAAVSAVALGAVVLEKHFTLDKNLSGPDHAASLSPKELLKYVASIRQTEKLLGDGVKRPVASEWETRAKVRKSLFWSGAFAAGTKVSSDMLRTKRPGTGLEPAQFDAILGSELKSAVEEDSFVTLSDLTFPKILGGDFEA